MPRDVSLSDSTCWDGGQKWVNAADTVSCIVFTTPCIHPRFGWNKTAARLTVNLSLIDKLTRIIY